MTSLKRSPRRLSLLLFLAPVLGPLCGCGLWPGPSQQDNLKAAADAKRPIEVRAAADFPVRFDPVAIAQAADGYQASVTWQSIGGHAEMAAAIARLVIADGRHGDGEWMGSEKEARAVAARVEAAAGPDDPRLRIKRIRLFFNYTTDAGGMYPGDELVLDLTGDRGAVLLPTLGLKGVPASVWVRLKGMEFVEPDPEGPAR